MILLLPTLLLLLLAVLLLGVRVLFVRGGKFPSGHIGGNPHMQKRGIRCAHTADDTAPVDHRKH